MSVDNLPRGHQIYTEIHPISTCQLRIWPCILSAAIINPIDSFCWYLEWLSQGAVVCNDKIKDLQAQGSYEAARVMCDRRLQENQNRWFKYVTGMSRSMHCRRPGDTQHISITARGTEQRSSSQKRQGQLSAPAPPCWLRANRVLLCCHRLAPTQAGFSSELRRAQPAPVSAELWRCVKDVCDVFMPLHVPRVQLSHCISIWKLCWHFSLPSGII